MRTVWQFTFAVLGLVALYLVVKSRGNLAMLARTASSELAGLVRTLQGRESQTQGGLF